MGNSDWGAMGLGYRDQGVGLAVQRFIGSGYPPCGIVGNMGGIMCIHARNYVVCMFGNCHLLQSPFRIGIFEVFLAFGIQIAQRNNSWAQCRYYLYTWIPGLGSRGLRLGLGLKRLWA